jgi:hypothetical protein
MVGRLNAFPSPLSPPVSPKSDTWSWSWSWATNRVRDKLALIKEASEIGELAGKVKDTGGVYFVTGFSGLFAP